MLILLTGEAGSGKSTAAYILYKYGFYEECFADPIKEFAISIGFEHEEVYGTQEQKLKINKFWGISGREFMQKFGSEVCRDYLPKVLSNMNFNGRNLWARAMEEKIITNPLLVISDGRFKDEAKLVKDYGGIIIKLVRQTNTNNVNYNYKQHKSETGIQEIVPDFTINNDRSIEELEYQILNILKKTYFYLSKEQENYHAYLGVRCNRYIAADPNLTNIYKRYNVNYDYLEFKWSKNYTNYIISTTLGLFALILSVWYLLSFRFLY